MNSTRQEQRIPHQKELHQEESGGIGEVEVVGTRFEPQWYVCPASCPQQLQVNRFEYILVTHQAAVAKHSYFLLRLLNQFQRDLTILPSTRSEPSLTPSREVKDKYPGTERTDFHVYHKVSTR